VPVLSSPLPWLCCLQELQNPEPVTAQRCFLRPVFSLAPEVRDSVPNKVENKTGAGGGEGRTVLTLLQLLVCLWWKQGQRGCPSTHPPVHPSHCSLVVTGGSAGAGGLTGASSPAYSAWTAGGNRLPESQLYTPTTTGCLPIGGPAGGPSWSQRGDPTPPCHWQNMFSCFLRGRGRQVPILSKHRS
jgi:hypothetical protein